MKTRGEKIFRGGHEQRAAAILINRTRTRLQRRGFRTFMDWLKVTVKFRLKLTVTVGLQHAKVFGFSKSSWRYPGYDTGGTHTSRTLFQSRSCAYEIRGLATAAG